MQFFTLGSQGPSGEPDSQLVIQAAQEFYKNGALGIKSAFSKTLIQELQAAITKQTGSTEDERIGGWQKIGPERYMSAIRIMPPFNTPEFYANPAVLAVIKALFAQTFKIDSLSAVCSYPGSGLQHIHRDHFSLFQFDNICAQLPPYAITVLIPLIDVDMDTGPTAIWEGSHRMIGVMDLMRKLKSKPDLTGTSYPITKMGDCYLIDYRLIHAGMPNVTSKARPVMSIVYSRNWFHDSIGYSDMDPQNVVIDRSQLEEIPDMYKDLFAGTIPS